MAQKKPQSSVTDTQQQSTDSSEQAPAGACPYSGRHTPTDGHQPITDASTNSEEVVQARDQARAEHSDPVHYGNYLQIQELLSLQTPRTGENNRDEIFFIIIHQAYELWFKQILVELESVIQQTLHGTLQEARRLIERVLEIEELLVKQIHLLETLTPRDFSAFRNAIRPASGFESVQFREVEFLSGLKNPGLINVHEPGSKARTQLEQRLEQTDLRQALHARMRAEGFDIPKEITEENWQKTAKAFVPLYKDYETHWELYRLCEGLLSHDQWLLTWRFHHVRVVERIIGMKSGTGGSPGVKYLERTLRKRAFPILVEARTLLDDDELFSGSKKQY